MVEVVIEPTFEAWHERARALVRRGIPPERIFWTVAGQEGLFSTLPGEPEQAGGSGRPVRVPRRFMALARLAACHRAADRWSILYELLWRLVHGERDALDNLADTVVNRLLWLVRGVERDVHQMKAFVRFRRIGREASEHFVAWHAPDHDVAALVAPHFVERYPNLRWSILTPQASVHYSAGTLTLGAGVPRSALPADDSDEGAERLWRTYYAAAFNPARVNLPKLRREMPARFWPSLPETREIGRLVADAPLVAETLRSRTGGATRRAIVPVTADLGELRRAAAACHACPLCERATQTVFGEGPASSLVLVGEQPGDEEDRSGRPFVGPAGEVLDRALAEAGLDRRTLFVTNAVKHFSWEPRGKRRIHQTPRLSEIQACRPWLEAELAACNPDVVVCLGGSAARALLGPQARVQALRGRILSSAFASALLVTYHPSAVLRSADPEGRAAIWSALVGDLKTAAGLRASTAA